ncbi:lipocalin-like domain-containing protein [Geomonas sp.]|uniref:lipocalin-like domain-containing protein n=1 Tax=Geomonas sp. TaxID=2651584 RepID=UPI002B471CA8|nr:lipocalin-like domain-containing protein [Geomonas sp.]HJV34458.1 lipocalin-like domain-containing protein [Geomonas sp.]
MRIRVIVFLVVLLLLIPPLFLLAGRSLAGPAEKEKPMSVGEVLGGTPAEGFSRALVPRSFRFPEDHGAHHGFRNEWWYFTGNLQAIDGRHFGYQLTFFRVALTPQEVKRSSHWGTNEIFMAHFALTDVQGKQFRFAQRYSRAALGLSGAGGKPLSIWLEDWTARETASHPWSMQLTASEADMVVNLDLQSLTPEILNGEGGLSRKSATPGNASYYYSMPRMRTSGTIRSGKDTFKVSGLSWLDREWSTSALEANQVGWDWFALQLDDGRDLMFYRLRRKDGSVDPFSAGTLVNADGSSRALNSNEVRLEVVSWWTSPSSGSRYPSVWRLQVPGSQLDLRITPRLEDQELMANFRYWEGAVAVEGVGGAPKGSGYLEMTGY